MANTFDYQRALEQANQPLNTLASGIISNSQQQAARMFQVDQSKQRRQQDLQDQAHSEKRQDEIRRQERGFRVSDRAEDREYEEQKTAAAREFNLLMELVKEDRSDRRSNEAEDRFFDRQDARSNAALKKEVIDGQGITPNEGESDRAFISRAAKERVAGYKSRAKDFVSRNRDVENLYRERSEIGDKARSDLAERIKSHATESMRAALKPKEAKLLGDPGKKGLSIETVIASIAQTKPERAQTLRADYSMFQDQAAKALEGSMRRDLKDRLDNVDRKIRGMESDELQDRKDPDFKKFSPFLNEFRNSSDTPIRDSGEGLQRVTPDKAATDAFMGGFKTPPKDETTQEVTSGRRVEGAIPFLARNFREAGIGSSLASEGLSEVGDSVGDVASEVGSSLRSIPASIFGGTINATPVRRGSGTGLPFVDIPAGLVKASMAPVDAFGNAMSDVSDALTGAESYPAPNASNIANYREDIGRPPRRYMMGDMQARQGAEQQQQAKQMERQLTERVYGGSPPPSPEEGQEIKRLAMQDGFTVPRMEEMVQRALRGDPVAIQTARQYLNRVRGPRSFSPF